MCAHNRLIKVKVGLIFLLLRLCYILSVDNLKGLLNKYLVYFNCSNMYRYLLNNYDVI